MTMDEELGRGESANNQPCVVCGGATNLKTSPNHMSRVPGQLGLTTWHESYARAKLREREMGKSL